MLFSELYKIMVKILTFVDFTGDDCPNSPLHPLLHRSGTNVQLKLCRYNLRLIYSLVLCGLLCVMRYRKYKI